MAKLYGLTEQQVDRLRPLLAHSGGGSVKLPKPRTGSGRAFVCKTPSGGIPARVNDTPGSATCDVYGLDSSGDLTSQGFSLTILNLAGSAVAGDTYIMVKREDATGSFFVDLEDCG